MGQVERILVSHFAEEHALVGQLLTTQSLPIVVVDVFEMVPEFQKSFFQLAVVVGTEILEELLECLDLLCRQIRSVVKLMVIAEVGKHLVGVGHILVEVVEVGQQQLSPSVEVVECLVDARLEGETPMEVGYQFDGVGNLQFRLLFKQFADGQVGWAPDGSARPSRQILVQEECCAFVGEYNGCLREVIAPFLQDVVCYKFKEVFHFG